MLYRTLIPVAALAVAACAAQTTRPPAEEPTSTTSVTSAALKAEAAKTVRFRTGEAPDDTPLSPTPMPARYRNALEKNPALAGLPYDRLFIEEADGKVVLRGKVRTLADAAEIERTIRQLKGVTAVENRLRTPR